MNQNVGISDLNDATGSFGSGFAKRLFTVVLISFTFVNTFSLMEPSLLKVTRLTTSSSSWIWAVGSCWMESYRSARACASISLEPGAGRSTRSFGFWELPAPGDSSSPKVVVEPWELFKSSKLVPLELAEGPCPPPCIALAKASACDISSSSITFWYSSSTRFSSHSS